MEEKKGGVTDIVNSRLRPINTSLWNFLSFLCLFNKELTSQEQILKNIHYFFLFFFRLCHRHLALETAEVKVQAA